MKLFCICDNIDTKIGMRLAGIDGVVVHAQKEVMEALENVQQQNDIGIVLISEKLAKLCYNTIYSLKLTLKKPLIVEIPDRHGGWDISANIARYVREAIGIEI